MRVAVIQPTGPFPCADGPRRPRRRARAEREHARGGPWTTAARGASTRHATPRTAVARGLAVAAAGEVHHRLPPHPPHTHTHLALASPEPPPTYPLPLPARAASAAEGGKAPASFGDEPCRAAGSRPGGSRRAAAWPRGRGGGGCRARGGGAHAARNGHAGAWARGRCVQTIPRPRRALDAAHRDSVKRGAAAAAGDGRLGSVQC